MSNKLWLRLFMTVFALLFVLSACGCGSEEADRSLEEDEVEREETGTGNEAASAGDTGEAETLDSLTVTTVGGSAGGFWSLIGEGIGSVLGSEISDLQYSYETGNGVSNTIDVANGKVPLGIAFNFEIMTGLSGEEPFPEAVPEVTALATLYDNSPQQIVISQNFADKYNIGSIEDIVRTEAPLRASVNQRGNLSEKINRIIFESYGFTYDDIESWGGEIHFDPYKTGADMMRDNRADLIGVVVFAPDSTFQELATSVDLKLLSINEDAQNALEEQMGLPPGIIDAGTYNWQDEDIDTSMGGAMLMADPNLSVDEAYTITKHLVENIDSYKELHQNLENLTPEKMADVAPAELHPGAELYFEEAGIID